MMSSKLLSLLLVDSGAKPLLWGWVVAINDTPTALNYNHGQKSWDTFAFLGRFPIHTGPLPSPHKQRWTRVSRIFFGVSTLYREGGRGGRTARTFRKWCTVLGGNREMTEKSEYCRTVPRTFVHDCLNPGFGEKRKVCLLHFSYAF